MIENLWWSVLGAGLSRSLAGAKFWDPGAGGHAVSEFEQWCPFLACRIRQIRRSIGQDGEARFRVDLIRNKGGFMKLTENTILVTGGGSGIGLALAQEFRKLGNEVIVSNRSQERLKKARAEGFATYEVDMADPASIDALAKQVVADYPSLNGVIQNAGIMQTENLQAGNSQQVQNDTIAINLLGPMRLNSALVPHFLKRDRAFIMTVSSGLAFLPAAMFPTYSATKAAIHSYSQSLRYQLKDTSIVVQELAPPYVQTTLTGEHQASDPNAMPLAEFVAEVMSILKNKPEAREILVERVDFLRSAESKGVDAYYDFFNSFNDQMTSAMAGAV